MVEITLEAMSDLDICEQNKAVDHILGVLLTQRKETIQKMESERESFCKSTDEFVKILQNIS